MKKATFAWTFHCQLSLKVACQRLGRSWTLSDSDYRSDSISGILNGSAWGQIFGDSNQFIIYLTIEAKSEADLKVKVKEAREKLFGEIFPLLKASEIRESVPGAPTDRLNGWPRD